MWQTDPQTGKKLPHAKGPGTPFFRRDRGVDFEEPLMFAPRVHALAEIFLLGLLALPGLGGGDRR
jgi:hypothetical protein